MATYKTYAVVLKTHKLGEIDRVLTLYTKERGKVSAVGKGIRRAKSKLGGRLEPFSIVDALLYEGKSLDVINQAETLVVLDGIRSDFKRMEMAGSLARLMVKTCHEAEPNPKLFNLLVRALIEIDSEASRAVFTAFSIKYLFLSGYHPQLSFCVSCGRERADFGFSPSRGGMVCHRCANFEAELIGVSESCREAMADMTRSTLADSKAKYGNSSDLVFEISACAEAMLRHHMGFKG